MKNHEYNKLSYYTDRASGDVNEMMQIANKCVNGIICISFYEVDISDYIGNLFEYEFDEKDSYLKKEYLFAMDYLSNVLSAYKLTGDKKYKDAFTKIISQFHDYVSDNGPHIDDLPIFAQTLLFVKAMDMDLLPDIPFFLDILEQYAYWLYDDDNYFFNNNHGIFEDLALLHIASLLKYHQDSPKWISHAVKRNNDLFARAYYDDFTNNEHSLLYLNHNNIMYANLIDFAAHNNISGFDDMKLKLKKSEETLREFAHSDLTVPIIGDGSVFKVDSPALESNESKIYPDFAVAVLRKGDIYLSLKAKTVFQAHAHMDISSITLRYKDEDIVLDTGQYNYDRYTPINRYLRSTAGHSGIFPLFADSFFQKAFCESFKEQEMLTECITNPVCRYCVKDLTVTRSVEIGDDRVLINDSFSSQKPHTMRQRFIFPEYFINNSKFFISEKRVELYAKDFVVEFCVVNSDDYVYIKPSFGVYSPEMKKIESTLILDCIAYGKNNGNINMKIDFKKRVI